MQEIAAVLILSAITAPVFAADQETYVTGGVGSVQYVNTKNGYSTTTTLSSEGFFMPGFLHVGGGYHFGPYLGVEGGISILSGSEIKSTNFQTLNGSEVVEGGSLQVAVVGTIPLNDKFDMFGKLGLANTTINYRFTPTGASNPTQTASGRRTNQMFALGGQFNLNRHSGIYAQYEELGTVTVSSTVDVSIAVISAGLVYNF